MEKIQGDQAPQITAEETRNWLNHKLAINTSSSNTNFSRNIHLTSLTMTVLPSMNTTKQIKKSFNYKEVLSISYFFDVCVNLISALLISIISWSFYKLVAKNPLSSYFSKTTKVTNRNYYKLSCSPEGKDYFNEFLSNGYVAIGWPQIGDLSYLIGKTEHDIREAVRQKLETTYPDMNNTHIGQVAGFFYKLLIMKPGDVLVLPGKNQIFICQVAAVYEYYPTKNPTAHRIKIDTKTGVMIPLNGSIPMTPRFKRVAQNRLTLISMNDYSEQIEDLIS